MNQIQCKAVITIIERVH